MIRLVYISSATRPMTDDDLLRLLEQRRARNERQRITGLLLYRKGMFLQWLEGESGDVGDVYASIVADEPNQGNYLLERNDIADRQFPAMVHGV